jgi:hypothetical protein
MSPVAIVLLVAAAALLVLAESARFRRPLLRGPHRVARVSRFGARRRARARPKLEIVRPESEEFARSVERDLAALPTIDEHDVKRR